jgi:SAM-dependent methyltransferase
VDPSPVRSLPPPVLGRIAGFGSDQSYCGIERRDTQVVSNECSACGETINRTLVVSECMFGTGETFEYGVCGRCESLRLLTPPEDLTPYYPDTYYSFEQQVSPIVRIGKLLRARTAAYGLSGVSRWLGLGRPFPAWPLVLEDQGVTRSSRILDVGSGAGQSLEPLLDLGYRNLEGIDAYLPGSVVVRGVEIIAGNLEDVTDRYDVVMLNHSFEHVTDPAGMLHAVGQLVRSGGLIMVRMPVAGCAAWRQYGSDWVAIDAPRHLHVFSELGFRQFVTKYGMEVTDVVYDSDELQFWGSEQYRMGMALTDPHSWSRNKRHSPFSRRAIGRWRREAEELNQKADGDSAIYIVRPARLPE